MNKIYTSYWSMLKNGELRVYDKPLKQRHVIETIERIDDLFHSTKHVFTIKTNGRIGSKCEMLGRCGYDRGPKRQHIIKSMLGE